MLRAGAKTLTRVIKTSLTKMLFVIVVVVVAVVFVVDVVVVHLFFTTNVSCCAYWHRSNISVEKIEYLFYIF